MSKPKQTNVTYTFSKTKVADIARALEDNPDADAWLDLMHWGGRIRVDETDPHRRYLLVESAQPSPKQAESYAAIGPCWKLGSCDLIELAALNKPLKIHATVGEDRKLDDEVKCAWPHEMAWEYAEEPEGDFLTDYQEECRKVKGEV